MASGMIHYVISRRVAEQVGIEDLERFLLGAVVAPDASSHADGSYNEAHFQGWLQDRTMKGIDFNRFADKYGDRFEEDAFYLGYWCHLMEDAIWFHDVVDKYVRIYTGEVKKTYYQKGYKDYERLNYLLLQEYGLQSFAFINREVSVEEVRQELLTSVIESMKGYFEAEPCKKEELELYTWEVITAYINNCVQFCTEEIKKWRRGKENSQAEQYFVKA
ncbi:MAG: zinc dependent phospholipase C family protein [Lachnospiraceae bacterium]|nr:zinc dependent phospholipase C family protein [Lachnospiraceae bacterium]